MLILVCYISYAVQPFVVYGGILAAFKISLWKLIARAKDAMLMAFSTRSSSATLPATLKVAKENLRVLESIGGFTFSFGSQINLDGGGKLIIRLSQYFLLLLPREFILHLFNSLQLFLLSLLAQWVLPVLLVLGLLYC
jgi:Na+/H+-dicarboxylate symporter